MSIRCFFGSFFAFLATAAWGLPVWSQDQQALHLVPQPSEWVPFSADMRHVAANGLLLWDVSIAGATAPSESNSACRPMTSVGGKSSVGRHTGQVLPYPTT